MNNITRINADAPRLVLLAFGFLAFRSLFNRATFLRAHLMRNVVSTQTSFHPMIAKVTSIILTIVCCACSPIFGQSSQQAPEDNINWFLSGGIGTGTKSLALNAGLYVFPYKRLALAAKYNLSSEVYLWGRPDASESSYSFLIGLADNKFQPRFILLAGYSRVLVVQTYETADQDGSYFESKESITNGIGVNLKAVLSKADHFGLSVNAFGNYNPIQPYAGITINLNIGLLRD